MAKKNNIRSMRFSDDVIEMIESQTGSNFSEKFENLVTRCMWELPAKEKEIKRLDKEIEKRRLILVKLGLNLETELSSAYQSALRLYQQIHSLENNCNTL